MVGQRLGNAGRCMRVERHRAEPGQLVIGGRAVPVAVQADVDGLRREDRRRPFDGMDLGDQRRDDQPGGMVDLVVIHNRIMRPQFVAQQIVLAREQRVQTAEPKPPAFVEAGDFEALGVFRQIAVDKFELRAPWMPCRSRLAQLKCAFSVFAP